MAGCFVNTQEFDFWGLDPSIFMTMIYLARHSNESTQILLIRKQLQKRYWQDVFHSGCIHITTLLSDNLKRNFAPLDTFYKLHNRTLDWCWDWNPYPSL